ncbi:hypothetical protein BHE74_00052651 [Ensete ventricosum]|nr:hypothetical protein GW17_00051550 [Ensete ventricosum]RWW41838.1 hypothetical protein BHE74_00052651 [Ensete ventricosum]RZR94397.1 hypothetical protein BHM03_00023084 [Ensete ventricosum]
MALDATYYDDMNVNPEVIDPSKNEDMVEVSEHVNDHVQHSPKPNISVASSVRELLECPVCLNAMYPPIHQCSNGHTLCSGCKPRVHNRCPTCRHELGNIRCLALEKLGTAPVYIAFLRFMGDDNEAKNYSYSLEVGGYGRKIIWQGVPRSIRDSHRKVRDSYDGLIIQRNMALFFSGGDRKELKLRVTGRIWKEQ